MELQKNLTANPSPGLPAGAWDSESIRPALWGLLGRRVRRYTMDDSSSVPAETAGELLESILFSIGLTASAGAPPPEPANLDALLEISWGVIEARLSAARELFERAKASLPFASAEAQGSTLKEIEAFFQRYDYRFFAHQIPCSIDYPLCLPVPENLRGVEYVREYLLRLVLENTFVRRMEEGAVLRLALSHSRGDLSMPVNLYYITVSNTLACSILKTPVRMLDVSSAGRQILLRKFQNVSPDTLREELLSSSAAVCRELEINDPEGRAYLEASSGNLVPRILAAAESGDLTEVFPPLFAETGTALPAPVFTDNEPMDDDILRRLMEVLSECSSVSEKVNLVLLYVRSLRDLTEILNLCFWGEESDRMFRALDEDTISLLRAYVIKRGPEWHSETGWETRLPGKSDAPRRIVPSQKDVYCG